MKTLQTIESQAKTGQAVEYRICEHLDNIHVEVYVDGKRKVGGTPEVVADTVQGHYIYGRVVSVYITNESIWSRIFAAYTEAKASLEASDDYKMTQLRAQRRSLAWALKDAQDELYEAEHQKIEAAGQGHPYRYDTDSMQADVDAARQRLNAFDIEHPEVVRAIQEERAESVRRNMWN